MSLSASEVCQAELKYETVGEREGIQPIPGRESSIHRHDRKTLSEARSRLYQRRLWPPNSHFAAFFKIYKIFIILHRSELKFLEKIVQIFQIFKRFPKIQQNVCQIFSK